jgi:hypothetical protein
LTHFLTGRKTVRPSVNLITACGILLLTVSIGFAQPRPSAEEERASMVVVFKDGRRQSIAMAEVSRINLKPPATIVFKDGHRQSFAAPDLLRIEFEPTATAAPSSGKGRYVGKWEVGTGTGNDKFTITLDADGHAAKSIGASHGTWTVEDGEARITWDDGWQDAIRKVGSKYEKMAHAPGESFGDKPSNVTAARNLEPRPI